ncbi:MAG: H-X9-DG-CTERM domain-containing protein, partial [Verrucomicrobiota bacterium]
MKPTRPPAFTLVELVVVLAIVAVLAALVLGALRSARAQGQAVQCTGNLRQLAVANLSYAADHNGQLVNAQDRTNKTRWHGVRLSSKQPFNAALGPLAPYLGKEQRVKICPAFLDALRGKATFEENTGGYGYNEVYVGGTPHDRYSAEYLPNIPRLAQTVMFTDTAFARAEGIQEYPYCEPFQRIDSTGRLVGPLFASVHFRHQGRANVAWCDGHVSSEP